MWDYVGIVRSQQRLEWARRSLAHLSSELEILKRDAAPGYELMELENILSCARLMVECATLRNESRGLHFDSDLPQTDPKRPARDSVLRKAA